MNRGIPSGKRLHMENICRPDTLPPGIEPSLPSSPGTTTGAAAFTLQGSSDGSRAGPGWAPGSRQLVAVTHVGYLLRSTSWFTNPTK